MKYIMIDINQIIEPLHEDEIWRVPVIGGIVFDRYLVSTYGRVLSLNYKGRGEIKLLKLSINNNGYYKVTLWHNGMKYPMMVHRLVAITYSDLVVNDDPSKKVCVAHKDKNHFNNHVSNLYWTEYDPYRELRKNSVK